LIRQGKLDEALAVYRAALAAAPDQPQLNNAAGTLLDLMGRSVEARQYFAKAVEAAATPAAKTQANRAMAMSYAFEGNCARNAEYEKKAYDYYVSVGDYYQQGEIADEAARVCIDAGDLDAAARWYKIGHDSGLKESGISNDRKDLWEFRYEHALARLAARRGQKAEAEKHVAAAKAVLDRDPQMAQQQAVFFPYLTGYVAFYTGDYHKALEDLQKAQNDPFIQCLIGQTLEKLGQKEKAMEYYRRAAASSAHNPPAAFGRPFARKKLAE
jgi:tetratricopeptide (TPR) repeat protein